MPSKKSKSKKKPQRAPVIRRPNQINFNLTEEEAAGVDADIEAVSTEVGLVVSRGGYAKSAMLGRAKARTLRHRVLRVIDLIPPTFEETASASALAKLLTDIRLDLNLALEGIA